ncbi:MAG TPA: hypothetical protein VJ963_12755 [Bacteroidales bacterium]|nr:hypothetical protein [Bacteroidales bacterium]
MSSLRKIAVSLFFLLSFYNASRGFPFCSPTGDGEAGMGGVCIMRKTPRSFFENQASLGSNHSLFAGIRYTDRFSVKELGTRSVFIAVPAGKTSLGLIYSHFGYSGFKRDIGGLACGIRLSDMITAGVQADILSERAAADYYEYMTISCETGIIISPDDKTSIGIHVINPVPNSLRKEAMPLTVRAGAGTYLDKSLFAGMEAEMSTGGSLVLKTGFEYEVIKNLRLRGGFITKNNAFTFGIGYGMKMVIADIGFMIHDRLGTSTTVSIIFKF